MSLLLGNPIFKPPFRDLQRYWVYAKGHGARSTPEALTRMGGTVFFPFQPGKHKCIAVKMIDFRGNKEGQHR